MERWHRLLDANLEFQKTCVELTQPGLMQDRGLALANESFLAFQKAIQEESARQVTFSKN